MKQLNSLYKRFSGNNEASDFLYSLTSKVSIGVFALGVQALLAWSLGPEGRGSYEVCLVFATILGIGFMFSSEIASCYFVSSERFSISDGISYSLMICAVGSLLAIISGRVIMELDIDFFQKAPRNAFMIALFLVPFLQLSRIFMSLLTAVYRFKWFAMVTIFHFAEHIFWILVFVQLLSGGVTGALWANTVRCSVTVIVIGYLLHRFHGAKLVRLKLKKTLQYIGYAGRYHVGKLFNLTNTQIGTILLAFFVPAKEIGIFAVASQFLIKTMFVPDAMMTFLLPRVSLLGQKSKKMVIKLMIATGVFSLIYISVLCVFANLIVRLLFSEAFLNAVPLIWIIAPGAVARSTFKVIVPYLLGINRPGIVSISTICSIIANTLLLILLLPRYGLTGAAYAMSCSFFINSLVLLAGFILPVSSPIKVRGSSSTNDSV